MTLTQAIGALLLASPFIGLFILCVRDGGLREALVIFGGTIALFGVIMSGCYLLLGTS